MFRVGYRALFSSYSLVHKCACACILYTSVHANVLSLTTFSVDEGSVLEILQVGPASRVYKPIVYVCPGL